MSRKKQIEAAFRQAQREYAAGELPLPDENDPTINWPLHKYAVYLFNDKEGGSELLEVFCERGELRYETLIDSAVELEKRHFPHVAAILRKVAEKAKSHVDDIIKRKMEPWHPDPERRRQWLMAQWLRDRIKITGQSWDQLVAFYGIESWFEIPATDGAERTH
jgi:hypothetical protein